MRKQSTTIYLTDDQREALARLSAELDMPQAALIRRGVDWAIDWAEDRLSILREGENGD